MMTTIITRSALESWGRKDVPPELVSIVDGRMVTWAEVMDNRRKWQAERLRIKRYLPDAQRAWRLSVTYFDQWLMGGWQARLKGLCGHYYGDIWIDRNRQWLRPVLMRVFPLLLPIGSEDMQWEAWKPAFAQQFQRRSHDGHPVGVAYLWWDQHGTPSLANLPKREAR